jgi:hypothetical protein
VVFTTLDVLAAVDPELADAPEEPELPPLPELPQAATARVATAKAVVAHHRLRIACLHSRIMTSGAKPGLTDHIVWPTHLTTYPRS